MQNQHLFGHQWLYSVDLRSQPRDNISEVLWWCESDNTDSMKVTSRCKSSLKARSFPVVVPYHLQSKLKMIYLYFVSYDWVGVTGVLIFTEYIAQGKTRTTWASIRTSTSTSTSTSISTSTDSNTITSCSTCTGTNPSTITSTSTSTRLILVLLPELAQTSVLLLALAPT